jgi:hypothetical protein
MERMTVDGVADVVPRGRPGRRRAERPVLLRAIADLADAADQAPSPHGTRPWRLRTRAGAVELLADTRSTGDGGPEQPRQTVIACGAALLNLRLAVAHLGVRPEVELLPSAADPDLLARVSAGPAAHAPAADGALHEALGERRTQRLPFTHPVVPPELVTHLGEAARSEGADLVPLTTGRGLDALDAILSTLGDVPRPATAVGTAVWDLSQAGAVGLLVTEGDDPADWLRAGQALQRVLLQATTFWLQARFHTGALEVPALRARIRRELCPGRDPQVILELGRRPAPAA